MNKKHYLLSALLLMLFSSASMASTITFYSRGTSDSVNESRKLQLKNYGSGPARKKISIPYQLDSSWRINSATLWVRALDDFKGKRCKRHQCLDRRIGGKDLSDKFRLLRVENSKVKVKSASVKAYQWYRLLDVTSYLLSDTNNKLTATIKARRDQDFWYKSAKLVIDYDVIATAPPVVPPVDPGAPVPVPSAIWLFGSALLGLSGFKRKSGVTEMAV